MMDESTFASPDKLLEEACSKLHKMRLKQFAATGITSHQAAILLLLEKKGPTKVGDIAACLNTVNSNVSNICTRLDKMGLIERHRPKENQRTVEIRLTEQAKEKIELIKQSMMQTRSQIFDQVTREDLDDIIVGLEKLNKLMDRQIKNHTGQNDI